MNGYLSGNFAPVSSEITSTDLQVIGEIPKELNGRYLRNGANPFADADATTYHWFLGDGMVHGICLRDGNAAWYRNRFVGSDNVQERLGRPISGTNWGGGNFGPNTNVGGFAGTTWAMVEAGGTPVELTYELDTVARNGFFDTLPGPFTAHPKIDPFTREMHAMAYAAGKWFDHCQYIVVGTDGRVRRTVDIPMGNTMLHDMSLTEHHAIVYDFPVTLNIDDAMNGSPFPYRWSPEYGSRIGLLPREGDADAINWIDAPIAYAFHPLNAYERADGNIVVDLPVYASLFDTDTHGPLGDAPPRLERWEIDPTARRVSTNVIDETPQEFPRHSPRVGTREHRYGYATEVLGMNFGATLKHDLASGGRTRFDHGPGRGAGEPVFVSRPDPAEEDDGWLLMFTHAHDDTEASFVILDAQDLVRGPVAEVRLPPRVPYGFHGNWVSDASVAPTQ